MAFTTIRTQAELRQRFENARNDIESDEYLRQIQSAGHEIEDYREIDQTAKQYLGYMLRNIGKRRFHHARQAIDRYIAWKWMLGHTDADTFAPARDPRLAYIYLRDQIESGEWDRLTTQSLKEMKGSQ